MVAWDRKTTRLLGLGGTLCVLGAFLALIWSPVLKYFTAKELSLHKGSTTYQNWHVPPVPMHMDFYFFNWTNPEKIREEKPSFVEMGPYRYIERRKKVNVTHNTNGTISYRIMRTWTFFPEQSYGSEEDLVTTLNGIAVAGANKVRTKGYIQQRSISLAFAATRQTLSVTRSVKELLFQGYEDALMTISRSIPGASSSPYDKFGWFYGRNNSFKNDGFFNINSGVRNINELGVLKRWNYTNKTRFFTGKCGEIYGSSGDLFPPGRTRDDTITLFSPDVCRPLTLKFANDDEVEGVPVYKFEVDPHLLDNGTLIPDNECYCNGECVPSGVLNITQCRYGVPAFISFPHFLNADPYYREQINGMNPDPKKHTFYMSVEPTMGFPLAGGARIQVNLLMRPLQYVSLFQDVPTVLMPVLWVQHQFSITPELAKTLRMAVLVPSIGYTIIAIIFFGGVVLIFVTLGCRKNENPTKETKKQEVPTIQLTSSKLKDPNGL